MEKKQIRDIFSQHFIIVTMSRLSMSVREEHEP